MRLRKENILFNIMTGAGLYLLDSLRDRFADGVDDLRQRSRDTYSTASSRIGRAADVMRGEDHRIMSTTTALLLGIGVGVGVGMLIAPASGEETRSQLKDKISDRFSAARESATGTYGQ
jgi:YtxH-like protein